jgi:hypothetical protein
MRVSGLIAILELLDLAQPASVTERSRDLNSVAVRVTKGLKGSR